MPSKRLASPSRSSTESSNAPKGLSVFVNRAKPPSNRSKPAPKRKSIPPYNSSPNPTNNADVTQKENPMIVVQLGVSPSLFSNLAPGTSIYCASKDLTCSRLSI